MPLRIGGQLIELATRIALLFLLGFSSFVAWTTLGATPAFNPRLVSETIVGQGRVVMSEMMYDKGMYDFQRGYGFLMANTLITGETEAHDEVASPALSRQRSELARDALESAVRRDPGNAHAWAGLAWARARLGDSGGAVSALRTSAEIAPHNRTLALSRLTLAGLLTRPSADLGLIGEIDLATVSRDLEVLERYEPRRLAIYLEANPHLADIDALGSDK